MHSVIGEGSTFTFELPLTGLTGEGSSQIDVSEGCFPGLEDHAPTTLEAEFGLSAAGNALIADDHPTNRLLIKSQLSRLGINSRYCADGEEAWKQICLSHPAILITDLRMPGLGGLELTRRIRRHEDLKSIRVVGLTAECSEAVIEDCMRAGMDKVLVKPVKLSELRRALVQIIGTGHDLPTSTSLTAFPEWHTQSAYPVFDTDNLVGAFGGIDESVRQMLRLLFIKLHRTYLSCTASRYCAMAIS